MVPLCLKSVSSLVFKGIMVPLCLRVCLVFT